MTIQDDIKKAKVYRNRKAGEEKAFFERVVSMLEKAEKDQQSQTTKLMEVDDGDQPVEDH